MIKFIDRDKLLQKIKKEKIAKLPAILKENNICTIAVHPFFLSLVDENNPLVKKGKPTYQKYKQNVAEFFELNRFENSQFLFENYEYSLKIARNEFASFFVEFEHKTNIYYSADGHIYRYATMKNISRRANSHNLQNEINHGFEKLIKIVKNSNAIFVIGMFTYDCVANAINDLKQIISEQKSKKEIYTNETLVKDFCDFY